MNSLDFSQKKQAQKGYIGVFNLSDWWLYEFSEDERTHIKSKFAPLGFGPSGASPLTDEIISETSEEVVGFLTDLAGWFTKKEDRPLAYKIIEKAEKSITSKTPILQVHFLYTQKIELYYKDRGDEASMNTIVDACQRLISFAPKAAEAFRRDDPGCPLPSHVGYSRLVTLLEDSKAIVELCNNAKKAGWSGNWDAIIKLHS